MTRTYRNKGYKLPRKEPYRSPTTDEWLGRRTGIFCEGMLRCITYHSDILNAQVLEVVDDCPVWDCSYRERYEHRWFWICNPYRSRKELKYKRKRWWRRWRHRQKVNLRLHREVEPPPFRTQGRLTH